MNKNKYYSGIDWMRLIAAVLVITIHTSPLASYNTTGDFILTRVIARVAVPFFFMTTGYFTLSRYHYDNRKLLGFLKKTGIIYVAAIAVYLPLNIYNGYFNQANLLPNMLKDLVFDGTLYHLWYLPASMLGMLIAWQLVQKLDYSKGLIVAGLLYLIGLFGDSYYGIAVKLPGVKSIYDLLFELFDYTRNGIFFAPVFLMLGGLIAEKKRRMTQTQAIVGLIGSFLLLIAASRQHVCIFAAVYGIPLSLCAAFQGKASTGTADRFSADLSGPPDDDRRGTGCGKADTSSEYSGR